MARYSPPAFLWSCRHAIFSATVVLVLVATYHQNRSGASSYPKRPGKGMQFFLTEPLERGKTLHILGERHSGARWLHTHLNECFNHSITVTEKLTRWKHWFQYEEDIDAFNDLHVVTIFRNPFHWVESMRLHPYHSPLHERKNWTAFVTTPWTMPRFGRDLEMAPIGNETAFKRVCDQGFFYNEVVPCMEEPRRNSHAKYELKHDLSGEPYESVMDLRRDKILNFLSIEQYQGVKHFQAWKYEDLVLGGSAQLVQQLEQALDVKAACKPTEPRDLVDTPKVDMELVEWMQDHVDWDNTEALIGYQRSEY